MALPRPYSMARLALLSGAASLACCIAADARDLPATPAGAKAIADFFTTYGGAPVAPPALTVTPESADYRVTFDVAALNTLLSASGVSYDPATIAFKVFNQDDGAWRVEIDDFPLLHTRQQTGNAEIDATIAVSGLKSVHVVDPTLGFARSGDTSVDKASIAAHGTGIDETIDFHAEGDDDRGAWPRRNGFRRRQRIARRDRLYFQGRPQGRRSEERRRRQAGEYLRRG